MSIIRVAGASLNQTPFDWANNLKNIKAAIEEAKAKKIDILCLPELCITGYGCEDTFLGEWIYHKAEQCLLEAQQWCEEILVAIGLPMTLNNKFYNTTCLIYDKKILGVYAKQNMAGDGVHYEPRWFTPWPHSTVDQKTIGNNTVDFGDIIITHKGLKIGFEICEDAWRQERPACRLFEQQVQLILNPSASHFAFGKVKDREELVATSSKNFNCTYLYANLLGNEAGRMIYDGEILIARDGIICGRNDWLSYKDHNLIWSDIDFSKQSHVTPACEYPHDKNTEFVKAASLALFDYLRKSHSQGFVLSLSGGADSSTIAILVAEMVKRGVMELGIATFVEKLGIEKLKPALQLEGSQEAIKYIINHLLTCAYQGTINSSDSTYQSAKALAKSVGATFHTWTIDDEVKSYTSKIESALDRTLTWEQDDIALQNIQARTRSPIIWMLANIKGALLLTTSNRSEGDVGYTTMDGDTSGSIAPIAAVDKHFIINWLKWAENTLGYHVLHHVNSLQPSAELRPPDQTQTDEADLMPYAIIVEIEKLAIRDKRSPLEVYQLLRPLHLEEDELLKKHIIRFFRLWCRNQWKRERIAPSFHLDNFNVDPRTWCRFPILSSGMEAELRELEDFR